MSGTDKQALANAMREWPQRVVDARVKTKDGRAYRLIARNVSLLRHLDDPDRLVVEMRSILDGPGWDDPDTGSTGWNAVVDQAGPSYVWEWLIMDRTAPWADLFSERPRWNVAIAVAHTLRRGL